MPPRAISVALNTICTRIIIECRLEGAVAPGCVCGLLILAGEPATLGCAAAAVDLSI